MNYPIEKLLERENVKCHEIKATMYSGHHLLLHFFITEKDNSLPTFKIGYEVYGVSAKDLVSDNNKPLEPLLKDMGLIEPSNSVHDIFNFGKTTEKNEWTGEQAEILTQYNTESHLSPTSPENISVNKNLRYVSEMADNSIYAGEDIISVPNYLQEKDSTLATKDKIENSEDTITHSVWHKKIHFNTYQHTSNEQLLELFKKYKSYIDVSIPQNLDTESRLNIDMAHLFGVSFDIVRLQNRLFNKATENNV